MAFAQTATGRPIAGAVATVGVSDRVAFLRKTYGLLGVSLIALSAFTGGMMRFATETSFKFSQTFMGGRLSWLLVIGLFMVTGYIAERLAFSPRSRALQLVGLGMTVVIQSLLLQPILWILVLVFGNRMALASGVLLSGHATVILSQAILITLTIFVGLTLTVFISRKDFSFLRGALTIGGFAVMGVVLAAVLFGFTLGALFSAAVLVLMAGYVLFQTSLVMKSFPPQAYVAAALMLFSTVATMFRVVLMLLIQLNGNRR